MQRNRRTSSGSLVDSMDDDDEMEAMAKVWAHPEDLHLFPVSTLLCYPQVSSSYKHLACTDREINVLP